MPDEPLLHESAQFFNLLMDFWIEGVALDGLSGVDNCGVIAPAETFANELQGAEVELVAEGHGDLTRPGDAVNAGAANHFFRRDFVEVADRVLDDPDARSRTDRFAQANADVMWKFGHARVEQNRSVMTSNTMARAITTKRLMRPSR